MLQIIAWGIAGFIVMSGCIPAFIAHAGSVVKPDLRAYAWVYLIFSIVIAGLLVFFVQLQINEAADRLKASQDAIKAATPSYTDEEIQKRLKEMGIK